MLLPEPAAWLVNAEADHARAHSTDTATTWRDLAATWDRIGQPGPATAARLREVDALLRNGGDRAEAIAIARLAAEVAKQTGAVPLAEQFRQLARRGRLDLHATVESDSRLNITPREMDVLRLLADGRTNRQIGTALFISEKTASVHVTNLLRKLDVPNRAAAAAFAQRTGIVS